MLDAESVLVTGVTLVHLGPAAVAALGDPTTAFTLAGALEDLRRALAAGALGDHTR